MQHMSASIVSPRCRPLASRSEGSATQGLVMRARASALCGSLMQRLYLAGLVQQECRVVTMRRQEHQWARPQAALPTIPRASLSQAPCSALRWPPIWTASQRQCYRPAAPGSPRGRRLPPDSPATGRSLPSALSQQAGTCFSRAHPQQKRLVVHDLPSQGWLVNCP